MEYKKGCLIKFWQPFLYMARNEFRKLRIPFGVFGAPYLYFQGLLVGK